MNRSVDLDTALRSLAAHEVKAVLEPYLHLLDRLADTVSAVPARPAQQPLPHSRRGPVEQVAGRSGGLAERFCVGQIVQYRQGRAVFEAKVVEIDSELDELMLERLSDSKYLLRPAAKVMPADDSRG